MYAVIKDGEHQYRVEEGLVFDVQRKDLADDQTAVEFNEVLMIGDVEGGPKIGRPFVGGARVSASIVEEIKDEKIVIRKFRRRKNYALKQGHRQRYLRVRVDKISS